MNYNPFIDSSTLDKTLTSRQTEPPEFNLTMNYKVN